jgi:hypothetical protein
MGYFKKRTREARDCRRERQVRASCALRRNLEKPLYEAWSFAEDFVEQFWSFTSEALVALADLFPTAPGSVDVTIGSAEDVEFAMLYPVVWTLVSAHVDDGGKARETSTLLFFLDGGAWKVRLSERNHRLDLWAGGCTFSEALGGLESQLLKRPVPWRKQAIPAKNK